MKPRIKRLRFLKIHRSARMEARRNSESFCRKLLAREESSIPSLDGGREVLALTAHKCSARSDNGNLAGETTEMEKKNQMLLR